MSAITGVVISGANNIFQVVAAGRIVRCRIKGKVLQTPEAEYNALAPGDRVELASAQQNGAQPQIVARCPRRNSVARWNRKRRAVQTLAANVDCVAAVTSPHLPPFRPRFLDRIVVACELGAAEVIIVLNKRDQGIPRDCASRLDGYRGLGYPTFEVSAADGSGLAVLRQRFKGRTVALVGQSGVGKSSLINALIPQARQRTGEVSAKYRRGRHVTAVGCLIEGDDLSLIDTPGIREIDLYPNEPVDIAWAFREFRDVECLFAGCSHLHEPQCGVRDLVEQGAICADRYVSYCNMVADRQVSASAVRS
ncbi:MAG: ribosome small subunit-dependent GTPase A [Spirochaetaceae bacterium]|nr:MAG: ribosome small subunit-dependent GTPase A [Spirochaetaceae bacterium]